MKDSFVRCRSSLPLLPLMSYAKVFVRFMMDDDILYDGLGNQKSTIKLVPEKRGSSFFLLYEVCINMVYKILLSNKLDRNIRFIYE